MEANEATLEGQLVAEAEAEPKPTPKLCVLQELDRIMFR
jgi:hypothetical protein